MVSKWAAGGVRKGETAGSGCFVATRPAAVVRTQRPRIHEQNNSKLSNLSAHVSGVSGRQGAAGDVGGISGSLMPENWQRVGSRW